MAITYSLAPIPIWIIMNNAGTAAGGARLFTYRSLNPTQHKIVLDQYGQPYPNPIIFDLNGTQGPFYWQVDDSDLDDKYYLEAYEAPIPGSGSDRGPLIWTLNNYSPTGSGGGGVIINNVPLTNYIANNVFIDHIDDMSTFENLTNLVIAPSNHKGFTPALINPVVSTYGTLGPDTRFVKNDTGIASDKITFPLFALDNSPLISDVTPVDYILYECTGNPVGEIYKSFQFPITQKVKNLSNKEMTFKVWAKVSSGTVTINAYVLQYFGSGTSASAEVRQIIDSFDLDTNWQSCVGNVIIPDLIGKSLGTPGQQTDDDALYVQLDMPLGISCQISFTKPSLYLGEFNPDENFETYDQINSIDSTPRTGDIKTSMISSAPKGWVALNDGSIGNVGSLATTRANQDTFQLYKTIWDGVLDAWAPVSTGRGASAIDDFVANKTLTLPRSLGRALSGAGAGSGLTPRVLGEYDGNESNSVSISGVNLPPHTHTVSSNAGTNVTGAQNVMALAQTSSTSYSAFSVGNGPGTSTPLDVPSVTPSSFMNVFIKL